MRFRRWHRPEPYRDSSRKRAAFHRKQRLEREALPLFADQIAAGQHGVEEEMARRVVWWDELECDRRRERAAWWRRGRARLFSFPDDLRQTIRKVWRTCPYPADPASFADSCIRSWSAGSTRTGRPRFSMRRRRRGSHPTRRASTRPSARSATARSAAGRRPRKPTSFRLHGFPVLRCDGAALLE